MTSFMHITNGQATQPINMVLHCPKCGMQHIDQPEGQFIPGFTGEESIEHSRVHGLWINPPHRSHLCRRDEGGCGTIWRPADVPTNGVEVITTRGKADTWPAGVPPTAPSPLAVMVIDKYGQPATRAFLMVEADECPDAARCDLMYPHKGPHRRVDLNSTDGVRGPTK